MRILIFGGGGFLGKEIVSQLIGTDCQVDLASRNSENSYRVDISNFEDFEKLPDNYFDIIVNCATVLPGGNYLDNEYLEKIYKTNILGTQNICKWIATQKSIKKIINCSTLVVVDKPWPTNLSEMQKTYPTGDHVLYSGSKLFQELLIQTFAIKNKVDFVNVRFSAIYGNEMPKGGVIWSLFNQAKLNRKINIKNGNKVSFDFIHVEDAAKSVISLFKNSANESILNIASGKETRLIELANIVKNCFSFDVEVYNEDDSNTMDNFSIINISNLNKVIDTNDFVQIEDGITQVIKTW